MEFSRELRDDVLAGDITVSIRLWKRPQVKEGGRYRVGLGMIEIDAIELVPFAAITEADVRQAGEPDRETLRRRAAHAGPIDEDTLVYRIELHALSPDAPTRGDAEAAILGLLARRDPGKTICPSDAARALGGDAGFGPLMPLVRDAARALVAARRIEVTQSGRVVDLDRARGPIRLGIPDDRGRSD